MCGLTYKPAPDGAKVRNLLERYLEQCLLFYTTHAHQLEQDSATSKLQTEMQSTIKRVSEAHPTAPVTLAVWGTNDVLNRQGYAPAAWCVLAQREMEKGVVC